MNLVEEELGFLLPDGVSKAFAYLVFAPWIPWKRKSVSAIQAMHIAR